MRRISVPYALMDSHAPLPPYDREPSHDKMQQDRDVMVSVRDGVCLCVDIYRPDAPGAFPALLAIAPHNKDLQTPEACEASGPQPAWAPLWLGAQEAGDTGFFVSRGFAHIIGNPRGVGKSEDGTHTDTDFYDLIEWIAEQPWCDGNIGMVGISAYAGSQWRAAMQAPPHLKAIFPYDARATYAFQDRYPGGVLHVFWYLLNPLNVTHEVRSRPGPLAPAQEQRFRVTFPDVHTIRYGFTRDTIFLPLRSASKPLCTSSSGIISEVIGVTSTSVAVSPGRDLRIDRPDVIFPQAQVKQPPPTKITRATDHPQATRGRTVTNRLAFDAYPHLHDFATELMPQNGPGMQGSAFPVGEGIVKVLEVSTTNGAVLRFQQQSSRLDLGGWDFFHDNFPLSPRGHCSFHHVLLRSMPRLVGEASLSSGHDRQAKHSCCLQQLPL